jgi:S-adenosylmethionine hydrolase
MKRIFLILVVVFMILSFSSCADSTVIGSVVEVSANGDAKLDIMPQKLIERADIGDTVIVTAGNFSEEMLFVDEIVTEDGKLQLLLDREAWVMSVSIYKGDFCKTYGIEVGDKLMIKKKTSN